MTIKTTQIKEVFMAGWFEVNQASDGQYRFVLKAGIVNPF